MSAKTWMTCALLLAVNVLLVFLVEFFTAVGSGSASSGNANPGGMLLVPGFVSLLLLMLMTFVVAVRYFDMLQDYIAKPSYHLLVPGLSVAALLLALFLQLRKVKHALISLRGDDEPAIRSLGLVNMYTNSLYFNAYIVLFWLSFAVLGGWWVVQKRPN
ncbi:hypothetical protein RJP21_16645 [Paenibacillus sp. VCA1]|uniref:hypothetical protein n=1 Tax=Paenibacillus sp. VCA1 TaxID=3039148 RepID=UPI00287113D3|nr:hypothetical protein [Paenibacillus sp. VCA1]MDR9855247.1 hypothetical protein [Paenibacillus sp. VCA1]